MSATTRRRFSIITRKTLPWAKLIRSDENTIVDIKFDAVECRTRTDLVKSSWLFKKKSYSTTVTFFHGHNKENIEASLQEQFVIERNEETDPSKPNLNPAFLRCTGKNVFVNEEKMVTGQSRILVHQDVIELKSLRKKFTFMDWRDNNMDIYSYEIQKDYYIEKQIGEGGISGPVRMAHDIRTLKKFAVKSINLWTEMKINGLTVRVPDIEKARSEVEMMRRLNHPNLVTLVKAVWDLQRVHLFVELMEVGDLLHVVIQPPLCRMLENEAKFAVYQICEGLKHLHDRKIAHCDIKLENVLVKQRNGEFIYKIGDFGLSCVDENMTKRDGTFVYAPPEVVGYAEGVISGRKADMWSLGVLIYGCVSGTLPWNQDTEVDHLRSLICSAKYSMTTNVWMNISYSAKMLIFNLIVRNPNKRLNVRDVFNQRWLADDDELQERVEKLQGILHEEFLSHQPALPVNRRMSLRLRQRQQVNSNMLVPRKSIR